MRNIRVKEYCACRTALPQAEHSRHIRFQVIAVRLGRKREKPACIAGFLQWIGKRLLEYTSPILFRTAIANWRVTKQLHLDLSSVF